MSGKALVGSSIALGHSSHNQILPVLACHAHTVTGVYQLAVAVPGQLVLFRATDATGQRHLASHAALHLPRAHHHLQGLCRLGKYKFRGYLPSLIGIIKDCMICLDLTDILLHSSHIHMHSQALTFDQQPADHLSIAISVPHLTHVCACVTGLCSLYQQAGHTLSEARVGLQRPVVLQPAVFGRGVTGGLAGQLHPMRRHHLTPLEAVQDVGR